MRSPWAPRQVPTAGLPLSALLHTQGDSGPPQSSPRFYTCYSSECLLLALAPSVWGPWTLSLTF